MFHLLLFVADSNHSGFGELGYSSFEVEPKKQMVNQLLTA